tara:strand:+ start:681 stop:1130 length:450 start_codon:yes stop_codon:yes gene_type:complete
MPHKTARVAMAGEYLCASFLTRFCDSVIIAPEGHKADLILDHCHKLYRVQVKTTNSVYKKDGNDYYRWDFRRSVDKKSKEERYSAEDVDFFALVALPRNFIVFVPYKNAPNSFAKKIEEFKKIDPAESLQETLDVINKTPKLDPLYEFE